MAELPEIETVRRGLDREVVGKKVKTVDVHDNKAVGGAAKAKALAAALEGNKLTGVGRRGLLLVLSIENDQRLVVDMTASGRLRKNANKDDREDGTIVSIVFTQGGQLRILAGDEPPELVLTDDDELLELYPQLAELGFDLFDRPMSWTQFARELMSRSGTLRQLLLDDSFIVGLGDLYTDEILHDALLRYDRTPDTLSSQEIRRLYRSIVGTLHDAVKHGGTSIDQAPFTDLLGEPGGYQEYLAVYGRDGEMSSNRRGVVLRKKVGGRWTYFSDSQV